MDEATAFLLTLEATPPTAPTACAGWNAHHLVAHLAAGAAEMASLTEGALVGAPARPTAAFAEREAPFVAMEDDDLRRRLVVEALRLEAAVTGLEAAGACVAFAGRTLSGAELRRHGRSEAALHRFDLAGDDDVGRELLEAPELTAHALGALNAMLDQSPESVTRRAGAAGITGARAAFGAPGHPDVVLVVDEAGPPRLELDEPSPHPVACADAATRLLALWGRVASSSVSWDDADADAARALAAFLWGPAGPPPSGGSGGGPRRRRTALSETR